jgi:hypothetical protein
MFKKRFSIFKFSFVSLFFLFPSLKSEKLISKIALDVTGQMVLNAGEKTFDECYDLGCCVLFDSQQSDEFNVYRALTTHDVFNPIHRGKHGIRTPDGDIHPATNLFNLSSSGLDLAVFEFKSNKEYSLVTLTDTLPFDQHASTLYVAGFLDSTTKLLVLPGKYKELNVPFRGYKVAIVTDAKVVKGMSGGPVLNDEGCCIGVVAQNGENFLREILKEHDNIQRTIPYLREMLNTIIDKDNKEKRFNPVIGEDKKKLIDSLVDFMLDIYDGPEHISYFIPIKSFIKTLSKLKQY